MIVIVMKIEFYEGFKNESRTDEGWRLVMDDEINKCCFNVHKLNVYQAGLTLELVSN